MKRDIILSGICGLILGLLIFFFANCLKNLIPTLISDFVGTLVLFVNVLFIALAEIPVMLFAMRRMSLRDTLSRKIIALVFLAYVSFASVYASIFVLLSDPNYSYFGLVLLGLGLVRFASGIIVK